MFIFVAMIKYLIIIFRCNSFDLFGWPSTVMLVFPQSSISSLCSKLNVNQRNDFVVSFQFGVFLLFFVLYSRFQRTFVRTIFYERNKIIQIYIFCIKYRSHEVSPISYLFLVVFRATAQIISALYMSNDYFIQNVICFSLLVHVQICRLYLGSAFFYISHQVCRNVKVLMKIKHFLEATVVPQSVLLHFLPFSVRVTKLSTVPLPQLTPLCTRD